MATYQEIIDASTEVSNHATDLVFAQEIKTLYGGGLKYSNFSFEPNFENDEAWRIANRREFKVVINTNEPFYIGEPQRVLLEGAIKGSIDTSIAALTAAYNNAVTNLSNLLSEGIT